MGVTAHLPIWLVWCHQPRGAAQAMRHEEGPQAVYGDERGHVGRGLWAHTKVRSLQWRARHAAVHMPRAQRGVRA